MQRIKEVLQSPDLRAQIGRSAIIVPAAGVGNRGCGGWARERGVSGHLPSVRSEPPCAL